MYHSYEWCATKHVERDHRADEQRRPRRAARSTSSCADRRASAFARGRDDERRRSPRRRARAPRAATRIAGASRHAATAAAIARTASAAGARARRARARAPTRSTRATRASARRCSASDGIAAVATAATIRRAGAGRRAVRGRTPGRATRSSPPRSGTSPPRSRCCSRRATRPARGSTSRATSNGAACMRSSGRPVCAIERERSDHLQLVDEDPRRGDARRLPCVEHEQHEVRRRRAGRPRARGRRNVRLRCRHESVAPEDDARIDVGVAPDEPAVDLASLARTHDRVETILRCVRDRHEHHVRPRALEHRLDVRRPADHTHAVQAAAAQARVVVDEADDAFARASRAARAAGCARCGRRRRSAPAAPRDGGRSRSCGRSRAPRTVRR